MSRVKCPVCNRLLLVEPFGPSDSPCLVVEDEPDSDETKTGRFWENGGGEVLKKELQVLGIRFIDMRYTAVYLHASANMDQRDLDWHQKQLLKEMVGRKAMLLIGSTTSEVLLGGKISDYSCVDVTHLLKLRFPPYTKELEVAIACFNPTMATYRGSSIGEIRLALTRFAERTREIRRRE